MTGPSDPSDSPDPQLTGTPTPEGDQEGAYREGKRAGAHPFAVIIVVILGLWFATWIFTPSSKNTRATHPQPAPEMVAQDPDEGNVMFHVKATIPTLNVITIVVPKQATDSQVAGLIYRFRQARLENALSRFVPPTTPGHKLGDNVVAEIYVFSDPSFARAEAVEVLARGAHAPGHLYPQAIPFEAAMEHVRGHYRIDLNDTGHPDKGSLGFADDSGVRSKHYRPLF